MSIAQFGHLTPFPAARVYDATGRRMWSVPEPTARMDQEDGWDEATFRCFIREEVKRLFTQGTGWEGPLEIVWSVDDDTCESEVITL